MSDNEREVRSVKCYPIRQALAHIRFFCNKIEKELDAGVRMEETIGASEERREIDDRS